MIMKQSRNLNRTTSETPRLIKMTLFMPGISHQTHARSQGSHSLIKYVNIEYIYKEAILPKRSNTVFLSHIWT